MRDSDTYLWRRRLPNAYQVILGYEVPALILQMLKERYICQLTPIQMQRLPVALAGRDMAGIIFTGRGKTVTLDLPLIMAALEEEMRMSLIGRERLVEIILGLPWHMTVLASETAALLREEAMEMAMMMEPWSGSGAKAG